MFGYYRVDEVIKNYITRKRDIICTVLREDFSLTEYEFLLASCFDNDPKIYEISADAPVDIIFYGQN